MGGLGALEPWGLPAPSACIQLAQILETKPRMMAGSPLDPPHQQTPVWRMRPTPMDIQDVREDFQQPGEEGYASRGSIKTGMMFNWYQQQTRSDGHPRRLLC